MAIYPIPNIDEQHRRILAVRSAIIPEADVSPGGIFYRDDKVIAAAITDNHAHLQAVDRDASPLTAEGAALERWGALRGVTRRGATTARKARALEVRGTDASVVSAGATLVERNTGLRVATTSTETITDGSALVDVQTIDTGAAANLPAGAVLDLEAPPAGVNQAAKLVLSLEGGLDAETDGAYRARIVNRLQLPPQGGNRNDYEQWALDVTGVDAAFALPQRNGIGTVDLVALRAGTGTDRILTEAERQDVFAYVLERMPIGAAMRVLNVTTSAVSVEVHLVPVDDPLFRFDWDDGGTGLEVASYDENTRRLTVTGELPADLAPGARFVLDQGPLVDAPVRVVQALTGADAFIVALDPDVPLTGVSPGQRLYAAGPLTEPVRQAILNGYELADGTMAPGINQLGPANEESRYGSWIDTVEAARIAAAAGSVAGVYRVTVPEIGLDSVPIVGEIARPSDPATMAGALPEETQEIGLLAAGQVLVREG